MKARIHILATPRFDVEVFCAFAKQATAKDVETSLLQDCSWKRSPGAGEAEELVEAAGRICYMSFGERQSPKSNADYIRHLIQSGHESVLEHVNWTFLLEGVSRAFTHQLVRHRAGFAFSQLSQQYCDEERVEFVIPQHLEQFPEANKAWQEYMEAARKVYAIVRDATSTDHTVLGLGGGRRETLRAVRSMARSVLPNATETKIVVTANARAWRHFLRVRGSIPGDAEMRHVAAELLMVLKNEAPALFFDFRLEKLSDNSPIVIHSSADMT